SSTILTVLLAIICFGETSNLVFKLIATAILALGIFLMVEKKMTEGQVKGRSWMIYAVLSAVFAALTSILAKARFRHCRGIIQNMTQKALRT
ncbi:MAG: multidrug DMT transporter permease, partial [Eubacteriales bacterium]|nr:multidrug DMT transporter permease [Candidatus Colimorpha enterica]